ncbi:MAG: acetate kinase, partial [Hyphomicrobium sp.]|nr:acetate kinase [Hyphomicrobium sp.]
GRALMGRELLASTDPRAKMALDYFTYRISLFAGMLAAAMRGLDGFVFTAGIGEHAPSIREAVIRQMDWLGVELDPDANEQSALRISTRDSKVGCYVIPTDEELMIARHTWRVVTQNVEKSVWELRA